ncbi:hypothetical protein PAP_03265 [Palaeococcus pacificus DY20341]|uniref:Uncharacterized protein n=1 Tax=Palaeococcus pacificus DY20341 TaxID=1343739 RepID=A0A075LWZ2_9EURY|nr:hypothetical protein [Palaeococcus pacificus]AIF69073.1 hypothetical protein PAP_03265 [Palaeococcus pacificus DY20341]
MEKLKKVIEEFNKYHGSEAEARIVGVSENEVLVDFKGSFCKTCGLYDYFDDLKWEAIDFGLNIEPVEVLESEETFEKGKYVVKYKIRQ